MHFLYLLVHWMRHFLGKIFAKEIRVFLLLGRKVEFAIIYKLLSSHVIWDEKSMDWKTKVDGNDSANTRELVKYSRTALAAWRSGHRIRNKKTRVRIPPGYL
jgi:hypothetical protein